MTSFSFFPPEILLIILSYLTLCELSKCSEVEKYLYEIIRFTRSLWKKVKLTEPISHLCKPSLCFASKVKILDYSWVRPHHLSHFSEAKEITFKNECIKSPYTLTRKHFQHLDKVEKLHIEGIDLGIMTLGNITFENLTYLHMEHYWHHKDIFLGMKQLQTLSIIFLMNYIPLIDFTCLKQLKTLSIFQGDYFWEDSFKSSLTLNIEVLKLSTNTVLSPENAQLRITFPHIKILELAGATIEFK